MNNYLKSAISTIYGEDDDFILLGLTGRTGSGCSTVANILKSKKEDVNHSLYSGNNPSENIERKELIIRRHFQDTWSPFSLIQVRSILTLLLSECGVKKAVAYVKENSLIVDRDKINEFSGYLEIIS